MCPRSSIMVVWFRAQDFVEVVGAGTGRAHTTVIHRFPGPKSGGISFSLSIYLHSEQDQQSDARCSQPVPCPTTSASTPDDVLH